MLINQDRPIIRYENIALLQSDISGYNLASNSGENLSFLPLVQSINFSIDTSRTNIGSLGTKGFIDQSTRDAPNVRLSINTIEDFGHLFSNLVTGDRVRDDLNFDRNFYAYIAPSIGLDSKEDSQSGQFVSFGNCFLTAATISQSLKGFVSSSYSFVASNFQAEEVKPFYVDPSNIVYTGVSVPALDLMGDQSQQLITEISGVSKYYKQGAEKIMPSYSTNVIISGSGSVGNFLVKSESIQNFNISLNVNRKPIYSIGKKYPLTRKALFPNECSFNFSNRVSSFEVDGDRANLKDFLNSDEVYTLIVSGKNKGAGDFYFKADEAKMSSQSSSSSIQADVSTSLTFSFELNKFTASVGLSPYTTDFHGFTQQTRNITTPLTYSQYFGDDATLTAIYIGSNVPSIGEEAFIRCTSLGEVTIPNSVTSIGRSAFFSCTSLTSIVIPDSVATIGIRAFQNCISLETATLPSNAGFLTIREFLFAECDSLTSVTIPDTVTSIGLRAFRNCKSLTSIAIPASVNTMDDQLFQACNQLSTINCYVAKDIVDASVNIFFGTASPLTINVPVGTPDWVAGTSLTIGGNTNVTVNLV